MDTTGELGGCGNFEDESWSMQNVFTAVANSVSVKDFPGHNGNPELQLPTLRLP
jgi:hypothetical protein